MKAEHMMNAIEKIGDRYIVEAAEAPLTLLQNNNKNRHTVKATPQRIFAKRCAIVAAVLCVIAFSVGISCIRVVNKAPVLKNTETNDPNGVTSRPPMVRVNNKIYRLEKVVSGKDLEKNDLKYLGTIQSTVLDDEELLQNFQANSEIAGFAVYLYQNSVVVKYKESNEYAVYERLVE